MTSLRPYMIRAVYEWAVDNDLTPMIMVRNEMPSTDAGLQQDPFIFYNLSPQAVRDLVIDETALRFHARFGGVPQSMDIALELVIRVFCQENKQAGISFSAEADAEDGSSKLPEGLMVVTEPQDLATPREGLTEVVKPEASETKQKTPEKSTAPTRSRKKTIRPHLHLVKPDTKKGEDE